jgi:mono/diheme cytochrome c family protein
MKVPEMIISFTFLVTGVWLFVIIGGIKTMHIIKLILVFASIPIAIIAFKRLNKGLALLSFLMIVGAYGISEMSRNKMFIPDRVESDIVNDTPFSAGANIYHEHCVFCHGTDGKKMYRLAPDLTKTVFNEDAIMQIVREGSKGKMPAYSITISDENIAAVARYVRSLHE